MYQMKIKSKYGLTRVIKNVVSHSYDQRQDKLCVFTEAGAEEIPNWSKYALTLGDDWKAYFDAQEKGRLIAAAKV